MLTPEAPVGHRDWRATGLTGGLLILVLVGGLITYKSAGAIAQLALTGATGAVTLRGDVVATDATATLSIATRTLNYLAVIWPALVFGILIGSAVRAVIPLGAVSRLFERRRVAAQLVAGASGAPLMLCSCCVAPVFSAVYERSSKLAPSLAVMIAAPALNPAALALTFLLFPASIAWGRLWMSVIAVFVGTALVARMVGRQPVRRPPTLRGFDTPDESASTLMRFVRSCADTTLRTAPVVVLGVVLAIAFADYLPVAAPSSSSLLVWAVAATAVLAVPIALPTFFEIPLAVGMLAAGAPAGAAAALLFAGPAVNLPSLLTVQQMAGPRAVALTAAMIGLVAFAGGLIVGT